MSKGTSSSVATGSQDPNEKWELSPYEEERKPQEVMTDHDDRMALHPECLRNDFMCPICLKLQSNTVAVMGCLHRFCKDCIVRALDNSNRECPVCRSKLPHKRFLRADPNFDMLISRLFPLRDEDPEENDARSSRSTRHNSRKLRTRYARDASPDSSLEVDASIDGISSSSHSPGQSNGLICQRSLAPVEEDVEVVLEPLSPSHNPKDWLSQKRYIKVSPAATVNHMIKYLSTRYRLDVRNDPMAMIEEVDESLFTLCVPNGPGQFQPVSPEETLGGIKIQWSNKVKNKDRHLVLHYAYNIGSSDEGSSDLMDALPPGPPPPSLHNNHVVKK